MPDFEGAALQLVCDSDRLSDWLGQELASRGFEIDHVRSAAASLDGLRANDPAGIVSSYRLPDLNGVRLLRSVRATHPNLPFVLVPEDGSERIASDAIEAGVSRYIVDEGAETVVDRITDSLRGATPWADDEGGRRYSHLVETAPVPINLFDSTGETIWCNDATLDLLGIDSRDELIGDSIFEFIHPADRELAESEVERVTGQGESVGPTQMKVIRTDGTVRHIYVSTAVGQFLGENIGQAIAVDVTQLRELREALQSEQRLVDTALDSLEDLFYVVDGEGALCRWNQTVTAVTGIDEDRLSGRPVTDLFADADRDRIADSIETVIETGSDTVEANVVNRNGREVPYEFRTRRLKGADDSEAVRIVSIGRDTTVQRERERQLQIMERWLRHNIRNDLTVIQGRAELIRDADGSDPRELAGRILDRAEHLIEQADKEREIVTIITTAPTLLPQSVRSVVERQVHLYRERYPTAEIEFGATTDFTAEAIPQLDLAVAELIENAVEHNDRDQPRVEIEVTAGEERGTVRIADDGPGIPQMEFGELLVERSVDQIHHGKGLGLSVAYWVARKSGGRISISENDPRGAVVEMVLPVARS